MTAQERAEIISQWVGHKVSINGQRDDIAAAIAAAIEAAVAEERERERERCAVIAEIAATHPLGDPCRIIAQRIRIDPAIGE